ncbi:unnamed protein product, partial [Discosporangium mesarthrocarpum]
GCAVGKSIRSRIFNDHASGETLGENIMDLSGKKSTPSLGGNLCDAIVRDDYSRFMRVYLLRVKSETYTALECFLAEKSNTLKANHVLLTVRSDDGGKFLGGRFSDLCVNLRIRQEHTTAATPQ